MMPAQAQLGLASRREGEADLSTNTCAVDSKKHRAVTPVICKKRTEVILSKKLDPQNLPTPRRHVNEIATLFSFSPLPSPQFSLFLCIFFILLRFAQFSNIKA